MAAVNCNLLASIFCHANTFYYDQHSLCLTEKRKPIGKYAGH